MNVHRFVSELTKEMSSQNENLLTLKSILGTSESDVTLMELLRDAKNDIDKALNCYFERKTLICGIGAVDTSEELMLKSTKIIHSNTLSDRNISLKNSDNISYNNEIQRSVNGRTLTTWIIGRRSTHGYTLCGGTALRSHTLKLQLEGCNIMDKKNEKMKKKTNPLFKSKGNFIASQLTFATFDEVRSMLPPVILSQHRRRVASFLVPLLKHKMITIRGHVAYDIGPIGTFQNIPLALQIFITAKFSELLDKMNSTAHVSPTTDRKSSQPTDSTALEDAANWLLLWLAQGDEAVQAAILADGATAQTRSDKATSDGGGSSGKSDGGEGLKNSANGLQSDRQGRRSEPRGGVPRDRGLEAPLVNSEAIEEEEPEPEPEASEQDSAADEETARAMEQLVVSQTQALPEAPQPKLLTGVTMRSYQLQALHWMKDRELRSEDESSKEAGTGVSDDGETASAGAVETRSPFVPSPDSHRKDIEWAVPMDGLLASSFHTLQAASSSVAGVTDLTSEDAFDLTQACDHPLWARITAATVTITAEALEQQRHWDIRANAPVHFWWNQYSHKMSSKPPPRPVPCRGGILADEMGLGKTVMALALIASDHVEDFSVPPSSVSKPSAREETKPAGVSVFVGEADDDDDGAQLTLKRKNPERKKTKAANGDKADQLAVRSERDELRCSSQLTSAASPDGSLTVSQSGYGLRKRKSVSPCDGGENAIEVIDILDSDSEKDDEDDEDDVWSEQSTTPFKRKRTAGTAPVMKRNSPTTPVPILFRQRSRPGNRGGTLIVCPMSLLGQWISEISSKIAPDTIKVCMYYGPSRVSSQEALSKFDVVVTTYGTMSSEAKRGNTAPGNREAGLAFSTSSSSGIFGLWWHRVILDEGHIIRNPSADTARSAWQIRADRRWILTGTPIQNNLNDLFSLVKFLQHEPWDQPRWWKNAIGSAASPAGISTGNGKAPKIEADKGAFERSIRLVRSLLQEVMLRRTKQSKDENGECIVSLPNKEIQIVWIELSPIEKEFYQALLDRSRAEVRGLESRGTLRSGYAAMLTLLMRLRQACDHPLLVLGKLKEGGKDTANVKAQPPRKVSRDALAVGSQTLTREVPLPMDLDTSLAPGLEEAGGGESVADSEAVDSSVDSSSGLFSSAFLHGLYLKLKNSIEEECDKEAITSANDVPPNRYLKAVVDGLSRAVSGGGRARELDSEDESAPASETETRECPVCLESLPIYEYCITICGHFLCKECASQAIQQIKACPTCMRSMALTDLTRLSDGVTDTELKTKIQSFGQVWSDSKENDKHPNQSSPIRYRGAGFGSGAEKAKGKGGASPNFSLGSIRRFVRKDVALDPFRASAAKRLSNSVFMRRLYGEGTGNVDEERNRLLLGMGSSKLDVLMKTLESCLDPTKCPTDNTGTSTEGPKTATKVVVFSQWTSMLDIVEESLRRHILEGPTDSCHESEKDSRTCPSQKPWGYRRLDGSMSQAQRDSALEAFARDADTLILLISLRAGGVGLNLTMASVVILVDPWWNPAVEDQAIDRIHRLGQLRDVRVYRLVCRETVEEKLLALQESKRCMTQQAIGGQGSEGSQCKLSLEELKTFFF